VFQFPRKAAIAAVAAAALALTACTGSGNTSPTAAPEGDGIYIGQFGGEALELTEPTQGGELNLGLSFAVPHLDPAGAIGGSIEFVLIAVFGHLLEVQPDGTVGEGIALGATTEDNTVWTLELREGVTFSDGTPLDADAVIAHVNRVAAEDSTSLSAGDARSIASMEAIDDYTVEFTLAAPNRQFDLLFATGGLSLIPSPTAVEEHGADFGLNPVGAGPFVVESFTPDGEIVLARNESYFEDGLPYLDRAVLVPVLDIQARIAGVAAGDIDAATVPDLVALAEAEAQGITGLEQPSYQQYLIQPNVANEFLGDVRVRKAISHAIDRDAINAVIFDGLHPSATSLLAPSNPNYVDTGWPLYDPEAATALIEEFKADTGATDIAFTMMVNQEQISSDIAALLQQQLAAVGITLTPEVVDPTTQISNVVAGTFDSLLMPRAFPAETTSILGQAFGASFLNFGSGTNPEFEALLDQVAATTTDEERLALVPEMLEVLTEWVPAIPVVGSGIGRIVGPHVAGFPDGDPNSTSSEVFDLSAVWVFQE